MILNWRQEFDWRDIEYCVGHDVCAYKKRKKKEKKRKVNKRKQLAKIIVLFI